MGLERFAQEARVHCSTCVYSRWSGGGSWVEQEGEVLVASTKPLPGSILNGWGTNTELVALGYLFFFHSPFSFRRYKPKPCSDEMFFLFVAILSDSLLTLCLSGSFRGRGQRACSLFRWLGQDCPSVLSGQPPARSALPDPEGLYGIN